MWHEELAELKESTYRKLRSNVFRMLREAGLLSDNGRIIPAVFSDRLVDRLRCGTRVTSVLPDQRVDGHREGRADDAS